MSDKLQISEIWETDDDKLLSVNKLREKYVKYARSHFVKMPHLTVENLETKAKIQITTQVIKEWRQKSRTRPRIIAIQLLHEMIRTAVFVKTEDDYKKTRDIESISEFENWCMIEGKLYKVRIIVKKQPNRYFAYYFGAVEQHSKKTAIMGITASPFGCTDLNITVFGYRLLTISQKTCVLSIGKGANLLIAPYPSLSNRPIANWLISPPSLSTPPPHCSLLFAHSLFV